MAAHSLDNAAANFSACGLGSNTTNLCNITKIPGYDKDLNAISQSGGASVPLLCMPGCAKRICRRVLAQMR